MVRVVPLSWALALEFGGDAFGLVLLSLELVLDALGFVGVCGKVELEFWGIFAGEVEHHLIVGAVDGDDDIAGVGHLIKHGARELLDGGVIGNLHFQFADGQVVIIEHHQQLRGGVTHPAVNVFNAIETDEVGLRGHTRPELDAELGGPACIAVDIEHEVALVVDFIILDSHSCCCFRLHC